MLMDLSLLLRPAERRPEERVEQTSRRHLLTEEIDPKRSWRPPRFQPISPGFDAHCQFRRCASVLASANGPLADVGDAAFGVDRDTQMLKRLLGTVLLLFALASISCAETLPLPTNLIGAASPA